MQQDRRRGIPQACRHICLVNVGFAEPLTRMLSAGKERWTLEPDLNMHWCGRRLRMSWQRCSGSSGGACPPACWRARPQWLAWRRPLASMPAADPTAEFAIPRAPFTAAQKAAGVPCSLRQEDMARRFLVRLCHTRHACRRRSSCSACDTAVVLMSSRRCGCLHGERFGCIVNICCARINTGAKRARSAGPR